MDDPVVQNPYKTLGVPKDANLATIRSAHRKLVLACHPDKVQDESAKKIKAEQFHQVQQAYEILSDENRRTRYDEKLKLAELRAEMHAERGPPRRSESYQSPRYAGSSPVFEMRNGRVYEERVPGRSHAFEEDIFASKFAESRPSAKRFDEIFTDLPPSHQRRTSGRQQEDRRRMREVEEERERREKESRKAKEVAAREEKERRRTKDRRRDMQAKSSRKFNTYMDTDGSDSDIGDRRQSSKRDATPPKRRYEDVRRKSDREELRRSNKREDLRRERDFDEDSIEASLNAAQEYMSKSRETIREVEIEPRPRPSRKRADSNLDRVPPGPPPMRPLDSRRRSSDRERSDKERSGRSGGESDRREDHRRGGRGSRQPSPIRRDSAKKDKKFREPEIVEPVSSGRKASLPTFTSDVKGVKERTSGSASMRKEPPRSSTTYQAPPESAFKHPGMRRAETMPINKMHRNEPIPLKSSHLKNAKAPSDYDTSSTDDSDSSEDTNEIPEIRPRNTTHKYKVNIHPEAQSPHTIYMEPDDMYDSPKSRRPADSPIIGSRGSSNRSPPNRSMSYNVAEDRSSRAQGTSRGDSGRAAVPPVKNRGSGRAKKLFGAIDDDDDEEVARFMSSPKMSSPKVSPADPRYAHKPRRSSEDVDRDAFPGSLHRSHRRPSYQRRESVF